MSEITSRILLFSPFFLEGIEPIASGVGCVSVFRWSYCYIELRSRCGFSLACPTLPEKLNVNGREVDHPTTVFRF